MQPTQSARMFFSAYKAATACDDIAKLESLYYIMVRERKACNLAAQEQLNKQQQIIQKLLKEQGELKIDLNILNAAVKAREGDENKKKLQSLAVLVMDKTLKKEKDCQGELDQEITAMTTETITFKKQKSVVTQCAERERAQNTLQYLEKKLLRTRNYLDSQASKIQELKHELKNQHEENARLQLHRTTYPHKRVSNDLSVYIKDNMKCTTLACENRTNVDNKITMMKKKEEQALAKNQRKIGELAALFPEEIVQEEVELETPDDAEVNPDDAEEAQTYDAVSASLEDTGEINLDDLEKVTLDLLVTKFIQDENQKCELFTLICDQRSELQELKESIHLLKCEIHQSLKKGHADGKGPSLLSDLRNKCAKLLSEVEDYETHEELLNNNLRDIKTVLAGALAKMGCECPEDKDAPEDYSVEDKVLSYLKAMEEKTAELLDMQAYKNTEASRLL